MTRVLLPLVLVALTVPAAAGRQDPPADREKTLTIDFVASDRQGATPELAPDDVDIWIGHMRAPVQRLVRVQPGEADAPGRLVILFLDDLGVPASYTPRVKEVARRFVSAMHADDHMSIVSLAGASMRATNDSAALLAAIDGYGPRANIAARPDVLNEDVLKNIGALAQQSREVPAGRKIVVAIGRGTLFDRPIPPPTVGRDYAPEWIDAMRALGLAHVGYYVIDPMGVGASPAYSGEDGFARATGGRAFLATNDFAGAVGRIMQDTTDFYVAGVPNPPNGSPKTLRPLEVRVKKPGVTVRARLAIP